jgi:hypothetical protein
MIVSLFCMHVTAFRPENCDVVLECGCVEFVWYVAVVNQGGCM